MRHKQTINTARTEEIECEDDAGALKYFKLCPKRGSEWVFKTYDDDKKWKFFVFVWVFFGGGIGIGGWLAIAESLLIF